MRTRPLALSLAAAALALAGSSSAGDPDTTWRSATESPQASRTSRAGLYALCGVPDAALELVATEDVRAQLGGASLYPGDELAFHLRAAGEPHVWPRAWSIAGPPVDEQELERRVRVWSAGAPVVGTRRCGVARAKGPDGTSVVAAIAVDALADLSPLPTTARVGQWMTLEGSMLVPASDAKVVLLGPRGAPKTVVASLSGSRLRSSFSVDQPGAWLVQVLATVDTGPRPVLEAVVHAGTAPPPRFVRAVAPGEEAAKGARDDGDAFLRMVNAARASEGLAALTRDAQLEKVALAHSLEMRDKHMVGHDVGGGDPLQRLRAANVRAHLAGENVASASTLENAHRALWASPSHRGNLLTSQFTKVGVAVVRDADLVWVTEMFSD